MAGEYNAQVGEQIITRLPPQFEGYEVVDGSWKPKDQLEHRDHKGARKGIFNTTFAHPGTEVDCQLIQLVTDPVTPDLKKSQVIEEEATDDNPNPGSWLVMKADPGEYGPLGLVFDCTLRRMDEQDLTETTPSE